LSNTIEATLVWFDESPARLNKRYRIKHTTRMEWAEIKELRHRINIHSLEHEPASAIEMNEIAVVHIETARILSFDPYARNRTTGSFILIDPVTNATAAAGMISAAVSSSNRHAGDDVEDIFWRIQNGELIISKKNGFENFYAPETLEALESLAAKIRSDRGGQL